MLLYKYFHFNLKSHLTLNHIYLILFYNVVAYQKALYVGHVENVHNILAVIVNCVILHYIKLIGTVVCDCCRIIQPASVFAVFIHQYSDDADRDAQC